MIKFRALLLCACLPAMNAALAQSAQVSTQESSQTQAQSPSSQSAPASAPSASSASADTGVFGIGLPDWVSFHAQDTEIEQYHPAFRSSTRGPNSLDPGSRGNETTTVTLFFGARLAPGWSIYADPEMDQGFGLSNTTGAAGYFNAEGAKVGEAVPYGRLQRLFTRYEIGLGGGAPATIMSDQNQVEETRDPNNIILTAGKFNVTDIFDNNDYAHDPTSDFLNWSVVDAGAFDYPADAWGYTYGGTAEWNQNDHTIRGGIFDLSRVPNGAELIRGFGSFGVVAEYEQRFTIGAQAGSVKFLAFNNRGDMANYTDATRLGEETDTIPNVALVRRYSNHDGYEINAEQAITANAGVFLRISANDGHKEAYEFTDINRSLSVGTSLKGALWHRDSDSVGVAFAINAISKEARQYFAAGGLGILVGDGSLKQYQPENVLETYYNFGWKYNVQFTIDNQYMSNPAYNATRGPVDVIGARFHIAY